VKFAKIAFREPPQDTFSDQTSSDRSADATPPSFLAASDRWIGPLVFPSWADPPPPGSVGRSTKPVHGMNAIDYEKPPVAEMRDALFVISPEGRIFSDYAERHREGN